jgi:hypothetical protein
MPARSRVVLAPELRRQRRRENNRMGGRMGLFVMARHKLVQIDSPDDLALSESIMRGYCLDRIAEGEPRAP